MAFQLYSLVTIQHTMVDMLAKRFVKLAILLLMQIVFLELGYFLQVGLIVSH